MRAKNIIWEMQLERFKIFQEQEPENFDVAFEIDGKLIYANKYVLETISTTFKSMLSERWKSKDVVIKLDTYSYDNFYQFLTFIYSGDCELTNENVSKMVDMAEFYGVVVFKNFCDEYISNMEYTLDNVFDLLDLATKYSLIATTAAINQFVVHKDISAFSTMVLLDQFINLKKSSLESFVTFERGPNHEEYLFEAVYKWAENRLALDANSVAQNDSEKKEAIKAELAEILPHIKFKRMHRGYFVKFVVPKYLFTAEEVGAMLCEYHKITVTVCDSSGRSLTGSFIETFNIYDTIKAKLNSPFSIRQGDIWLCDIIPPISSDIKKNENTQFYLVLADRYLQIKKPAEITDADYLLCEMKGNSNFVFNIYNCHLNVFRV